MTRRFRRMSSTGWKMTSRSPARFTRKTGPISSRSNPSSSVFERFFPGASHLQNPHPLVVHFPIAFLYGAALLYFLAWLTRRDAIAWAALWFLALGLLAAAVA